jgi:thiamine biosynthesis lipoprotein
MATRFEIVLYGKDAVSLRAAGEEALDEIERLEAKLSLYRSDSEVSHLNARAAREPVRVSSELFQLLEQARELSRETEGAFDITVAPLMRAWSFLGSSGGVPEPALLENALQCVGMKHLQFNPDNNSVRFGRAGVMIDLGAIGKGYAIERAARILRETGVTSALLHGGTSTTFAIGTPPGEPSWKVAIGRPAHDAPDGQTLVAIVPLSDSSLSVSAVWGKSFRHEGKTYGHVIDPRTGHPASNAVLAAVTVDSPTESDALSTALLTLGPQHQATIKNLRPHSRTLLIYGNPVTNDFDVISEGIALHPDSSLSTKPQRPFGESN